jgi:hypothetical protein
MTIRRSKPSPMLELGSVLTRTDRIMRLLTGRLEPKAGPLFMRLEPDSGDLGEDAPEARVERGLCKATFGVLTC